MNNASSLQQLVDDGVVDEVLQQIKSGKEADVFLVRKGEALLAAKVYKARTERNFKNNAGYLEGRAVRSSRDARAMAKGSRYGRSQQEEAWKHAEVDALYKLAAAGVRVPAPDIFYEGVLVMGLVVDAEGYPAPRLADTTPDREQALAMYTDLLQQAGIMLSCDLIHGDLSAFNVLLAHDGPTIIDLPQVISAAANPQAEMFFRRDVQNLHRFFAQFAPELGRRPDGGADLWNRYRRRELFAGYVPDLNALVDDSPVPTFKQRPAKPKRQGRGPRPVVEFKGQTPPAHGSSPRPPQQNGSQPHAQRHGQSAPGQRPVHPSAGQPRGQRPPQVGNGQRPPQVGQGQRPPQQNGASSHAPRHGQTNAGQRPAEPSSRPPHGKPAGSPRHQPNPNSRPQGSGAPRPQPGPGGQVQPSHGHPRPANPAGGAQNTVRTDGAPNRRRRRRRHRPSHPV